VSPSHPDRAYGPGHLSLVTFAVLFGISLIFRGVFACLAAFKLRKVHKEGADVAPPFGAAPA
jgi:hypothetical protein